MDESVPEMSESVSTSVAGYTVAEERANALSHALGALLALIGTTYLLQAAISEGSAPHITSAAVYGVTLVTLFSISTIYHAAQDPGRKITFQLLDHCAIYVFIAGTYTPFLLITLSGETAGTNMLIAIWGMAAAGVLFELLFRMRYKVLSLITYLAMGWMIVLLSSEMQARLPEEALALVVGGGLFYTFGVVFYAVKRIPFNHAIWHLFVLGGSACHFAAIGWYVVGASPAVA